MDSSITLVDSSVIQDGAVTTAKIADNNITSAKISGLDRSKVTGRFYQNVNALAYSNGTATYTNIQSITATLGGSVKCFWFGAAEGMGLGNVSGSLSSTAGCFIEILANGESWYRQQFDAGVIPPITVIGAVGLTGTVTIQIRARIAVSGSGSVSATNCQFRVTEF